MALVFYYFRLLYTTIDTHVQTVGAIDVVDENDDVIRHFKYARRGRL